MTLNKRQAKMRERRAHWREMVEAAARSGQSIRVFCRERKVGEHLFYHWRRVLELEGRAGKRDEARFLLVRPEAEASTETAAGLELAVEHGWRLRIPRGADEATLRAVLVALAAAR